MVELGGVYQLCESAGGRRRCMGVCEGDDGEVIISLTDGTISTYSVQEVRCTRSWQLSSSLRLTCPAVVVYEDRLPCYCAVRNDMELITWNAEVKWASDFTVTVLPKKVQVVLTTPNRTHLLVVFTNGSISLVNVSGNTLSTVKAKCIKSILHAQSLMMGGEECVVVAGQSRDSTVCSLYYIHKERLSEKGTATIQTPTLLTALTCCGNSLLTAWCNGVVCSSDLRSLLKCDDNPLLQSVEVLRLPAQSRIATITNIGEQHFAVVVSPIKQKGQQELVQVYDTRYATMQASTDLPVGFLSQKLYYCSGHLVSSSQDGYLHGCTVSTTKPSLATVMGRRRGTATEQLNSHQHGWESKISVKQEKEITALQWPLQDASTSAIAILQSHKSPQELVQCCEQLVFSDASSLCYPAVAALFYQALHLILSEQDRWPRELLLRALEVTILPPSLSAYLLEKALARQDWVTITAVVQHQDCVPESTIVNLLTAALSLPAEFMVRGTDKAIITRDSIMCLIFSLPKNDSLIQQPLACLSQESIMSLLTFLKDKVVFDGLIDPAFSSTSSKSSSISYTSILEWTGLILDTHFTSLSLIPEAKSILLILHKNVSKQIVFLSRLSLLEGVRNTKQQSLGDDEDWLYKIDHLELNFQ